MYPGDKDVLAALTCPTESCKATPPPYAFFALSPLRSNPDSDLLTKGRSLLGSKPNTGGSQAGWSTTSSASGVQTIFGKGRPEKVILTLIHDILTLIHAILTLIHAI